MAQGQTRESVKMALNTLRANKLRSGLTILGIVIGITTVITISSIINGVNNRVSDMINSFGTNVLSVTRIPIMTMGRPSMELLARKKFTMEDVIALRSLAHVTAVDGMVQNNPGFSMGQVSVKYKGKKEAGTELSGHTAQVADVQSFSLVKGRLFTDAEDQRAAHVCVLGYDTASDLFGSESPIGKEVSVESSMYTVIGVLDKQKSLFSSGKNSEDNQVIFPQGTFHYLHPEDNDLMITVKYDDPLNKSLVEEEIRDMMRIRRKVKIEAEDNFQIFGPDSILKMFHQITGGLVAFMIAVSSVGLMVGGVGVMNIMLVSVTERTREIGVRKAIGATKHTLLVQFTTEAVALCAVGGVFGVLLGALLTLIVRLLPVGLPASVSMLWVTIGFGVSCAIGLIFGIYPAWKAANLDPIEALRYE